MTQDNIIKMAKEAKLPYEYDTGRVVHLKELERFAALVAAAEREKVAAWMVERGYATGHGDSTEDLLQELEWQIREQAEKQKLVTFVCSTSHCRFTLTQTDVGIGERGMQAYEEAKKRGWVGISDEMEMPKQEPVAKIVDCGELESSADQLDHDRT